MSTKPSDSMSSRRLCSMPKCVLIDAYRAVPVKFFPSMYGMCRPFRGSCRCTQRGTGSDRIRVDKAGKQAAKVVHTWYFFANPKSITWHTCFRVPVPIKKLSGFTSRWMYDRECMNSKRAII